MDNKVSVWEREKFMRRYTYENMHRGGILGGLILGGKGNERLVTYGGDYLIKVYSM